MFPFIAVVRAILRSPSITSGAPISPAWIIWSVPARCFITSGRRRPWVSEITPIRILVFARRVGCADGQLVLALQLLFSDVIVLRSGPMGSSPERPGDDVSGPDPTLSQTHGNTPDL